MRFERRIAQRVGAAHEVGVLGQPHEAVAHPIEAHKVDSRGIFERGRSADVKEGVMSFLEKRAPKFPDRVSKEMPPYFPWWEERGYE